MYSKLQAIIGVGIICSAILACSESTAVSPNSQIAYSSAIGQSSSSQAPAFARTLVPSTTVGQFSCDRIQAQQIVDAILHGIPEISDQSETPFQIAGQETTSFDGSKVYIFRKTDGGFDFVFKESWGDCASGCINSYYYYFTTADACSPEYVDEYAAVYSETKNCYEGMGVPLFGVPQQPIPQEMLCQY